MDSFNLFLCSFSHVITLASNGVGIEFCTANQS